MSEFVKRKMRTYIALIDYNKDGVVEREDWVKLPSSFASFGQADKKKADHLRIQFENLWEQFLEGSGSTDKNTLTAELLASSVWKQRDGTELKKRMSSMIYAMFDLMNVNSDGYLQEDEHRMFYERLELPDASFAKKAFKAIDVNHDGKLSFEEFDTGAWEFFSSDDPENPNTFFFGPLVD